MHPLIIFPDIEAWATTWLSTQMTALSEYPWSSKLNFNNVIPRDDARPGYLVVVNRDGGATEEHLDYPRVRFNVWAPNEYESEEICRVIGGLLLIAQTDNDSPVVGAEVNGSFRIADGTGGARRCFWATLTTAGK